MTDRGEYRAIRRVLLDGPDFQKLSERARWVFVALKLNIGPTGIEVHYPAALSHQIAAQTGTAVAAVLEAMDELDRTGWIRREGNVLWIVGQLQHDPHMQPSNDKHRKSVQRHLSALPRLALVRDYVEAHMEWFPEGERAFLDSLPNGYRMAIASPSTDNRIPNTNLKEGALSEESGGEPPRIEAPEPEDPDAAKRYSRIKSALPVALRKHAWLGDEPPAQPKGWHMGREISIAKLLLKQFTPEELIGGIETFREAHAVPADKPWSLSWVYGEGDRWRIVTAVQQWREKQIDQIEIPTFTPRLHVA